MLTKKELPECPVRKVYPEVSPRVEYSLSDIGHTLKPMFESMTAWGNLYKDLINKKE